MVDPSVFIQTIKSVPALGRVAQLAESGSIRVAQRKLGKGVKAQYISTEGSFKSEPELTDTVLLSSDLDWTNAGLMNRSILVHEAFHAKDDLELAGTELGQIESEKNAWTAQGAYLISELSQASDPQTEVNDFVEELKSFDELGRFCLSLAVANAQVLPDQKPQADLLINRMKSTITNLQNIDGLYETPDSSLEGALSLIYASSRNSKFKLDGIKPR